MSDFIKSRTKEQMDLAESCQKECQKLAESIMSDDKRIEYQDIVAIYCFNKIAELQLRIKELERLSSLPNTFSIR